MNNYLRRPIFRNVLLLFSAQGMSYLIPLATIPYLMRSLGGAGFGLYSLAIAVSGYVQIPMEYGFGLSATRDVARIRGSKDLLADLFWSVTWTKLAIGVVACLLLFLIVLIIPSLRRDAGLHAWACAGACASAFFPTWLLQGMEKMKELARLSIVSKLINAGFVFAFVHLPEHLLRLLVWTFFVNAIMVVYAHWVALQGRFLEIRKPTWGMVFEQLRSGLGVFLSQVGFLMYANTNMIVLSAWHSPEVVGIYAIAEKIMRASAMMTYAISQAIFPVSARKFAESKSVGELFLRQVVRVSLLPVSIGCFLLFALAGEVIRLFSGVDAAGSVAVLRLFSLIPLSIYLCNIYGSQILLNLGKDRLYFIGTIASGIFAVAMQQLLIPAFGANGAAICLGLAELVLLLLYMFFSRNAGVRLFPKLGV